MSFPELHKACILHPGEDKLTTDIVVQSFTDRHVIIITQIGKMGTIISAEWYVFFWYIMFIVLIMIILLTTITYNNFINFNLFNFVFPFFIN